MDKLIGVLQTVLPVLLMLALGLVCRRTGAISRDGIAGLKALVLNITLPAVLINAFYAADYTFSIVVVAAAMFLCCLAALFIGFFIKKLLRSKLRLMPYLMTGFEAGMLGYALYTMLFGAQNVTNFATVDLGQVLFVFTVYMSMLNAMDGEGGGLQRALKGMATSPVIISIAIGVVAGLTGLGKAIQGSAAGGIVQNALDFIAAPTSAVILVVIGYELEFGNLRLKQTLGTIAARYAVMAALCALTLLAVGAVIQVSEPLKWAFVLMFMLPPPFVLPIFVDDGSENAYISASLSVSTLVSIVLFACIAYAVA